ncbi:MAG: cell wall-binding repeat-containing protein [Thermoleophilia bacterium]|nr:cell wall-binding repeat-containing protein [Thermoleophilia bacterium]
MKKPRSRRVPLCATAVLLAAVFTLAFAPAQGLGAAEQPSGLPPGLSAADWADIRGQIQGQRSLESRGGRAIPGLSLSASPVGSSLVQQAYLKAPSADALEFGAAVAISGDTVVVGAPAVRAFAELGIDGGQGYDGANRPGAAYVFTRSGDIWTQEAYLKASNSEMDDWFGCSVAISGDTIVVGAHGESSNATGVNGDQADNSAQIAGAAYVFARSGGAWSQEAYLKASNTDSGDESGYSVTISGDTVVVGAPSEDSCATGVNGDESDNSSKSAGAAYVFTRGGSTWAQEAYLKASNTDAYRRFGSSAGVSGDTLVVGVPYEFNDSEGCGAAYVFVASSIPAITGMSPTFGSTAGGTEVTITGASFTGVTGVTFGGIPATDYTVDSLTQIRATSPAHDPGSVQVQVTAPGNGSPDTAADDFLYLDPAVYTSLRGRDRFDTALKISRATFPPAVYPDGLPADSGVVLAPGWESYQEALCGAPLAAAYGGPVLLSSKTVLYSGVRAELERLDPDHVFCIGLTLALADQVRAALPSAAVTSINGILNNVYHMSYLVAKKLAERVDATGGDTSPATGVVTIGTNFPDAIGVSALACHKKWPILLTDYADKEHPMNTWVVRAVNELGITTCVKAGTYAPDPAGITGLGNFSGADRYHTNANGVLWARAYAGLSSSHTALATGDKFPDALAAGPYLAKDHGILLLSPLQGPLPPVIGDLLAASRAEVEHVTFIACIEPVIGQVKALLP